MAQTLLRHLTVSHEVYLAILRENPELRIEHTQRGELVVMPPTGFGASLRNAHITAQLIWWTEETKLGVVTDSGGGFRLPNGATRAPDAAWVSNERLSTISAERREEFASVCPDFAIELRSTSDKLKDVRAKMREYVANGLRLGWLIDPLRRVVEIYRPGSEPQTIVNPATIDGEDVLPGFVLDLESVFDSQAVS